MSGSLAQDDDRPDSDVDLLVDFAEPPSRAIRAARSSPPRDWAVARAIRERLAHGYAHAHLDAIRATVEHDLPRIEAAVRAEVV